MDILRVNNLARVVEYTRHEDREQPQKRQQKRKRERIPPGPVYSPNGELEEASAPNIDVLV